MPARAHWKGYLKRSLVSCPIALYPTVSAAERVTFRQVNRQTGNRLRQQLIDTVTGEVVEATDKGRGYEVGQNQFLMVEDAELDTAQTGSTAQAFRHPTCTDPAGITASVASMPSTWRWKPLARQRMKSVSWIKL